MRRLQQTATQTEPTAALDLPETDDVQVDLACSALESSQPSRKHARARYEQVVDVLETQGWLTGPQASVLATLAEGL